MLGERPVHRDLEVDKGDGTVSTMKRYVHAGIPRGGGGLGYGLVAQYGVSGSDTRFFHSDLVGTTRLMTDSSGAIQNRLRWTAFGEPLPLVVGEPPYGYEQPAGGTRYGYAGSWGYQNDGMADGALDIGLLQVGARYYDPAIGRFVMRDPIGIAGGQNVYTYCRNNPASHSDPSGHTNNVELLTGTEVVSNLQAMNMIALQQGAEVAVTLGVEEYVFINAGTVAGEIVLGTSGGAVVSQFLVPAGLYKCVIDMSAMTVTIIPLIH